MQTYFSQALTDVPVPFKPSDREEALLSDVVSQEEA